MNIRKKGGKVFIILKAMRRVVSHEMMLKMLFVYKHSIAILFEAHYDAVGTEYLRRNDFHNINKCLS